MSGPLLPSRPYRVGLTGGIGSGKSTVLGFFAQCGAAVVDADALARQCTAAGGAAIPAIVKTFGPEYLTAQGGLDREKMRALVFAHGQTREQLEAIVHPLVRLEMENQIQQCQQACIVLDIPLLIESEEGKHWGQKVHKVVLVDCSPATQLARAMARSGLSRPVVEGIMASQASPEQRRRWAADRGATVLWNEGLSLADLQAQVSALAQPFGCPGKFGL